MGSGLFWAELRIESLKLFLYIIIRYMSEEFLCKISSKYLEAWHSYHRKTWPAKFGVPPCTRIRIRILLMRIEYRSFLNIGIFKNLKLVPSSITIIYNYIHYRVEHQTLPVRFFCDSYGVLQDIYLKFCTETLPTYI